ncbi:hypothetical protein BX600DRAFT_553836 [Xylariales sp. PMI_506]|nr:hypothetical protein BX600DRAFT_553836 [Xylariales sp. PMI_506]
MASTAQKTSHLERTAGQPRYETLNTVILKRIEEINEQIRLFRLEIPKTEPPIEFLPGQWLDVYVPGVTKAGGFTITSSPSKARPRPAADAAPGYLELAIQKSPENPAAAWLWQEEDLILGQELRVRVGGSFVWPPPGVTDPAALKRAVFVAGGVGINPLVSMLSSLADQNPGGYEEAEEERGGARSIEVQFLYSMKDPGSEDEDGWRVADSMLFVERIANIFAREQVRGELKMFLTGGSDKEGRVACNEVELAFTGRRITQSDLEAALGDAEERKDTVVYVCGVPDMTDEFVEALTAADGLSLAPENVLCEKWW